MLKSFPLEKVLSCNMNTQSDVVCRLPQQRVHFNQVFKPSSHNTWPLVSPWCDSLCLVPQHSLALLTLLVRDHVTNGNTLPCGSNQINYILFCFLLGLFDKLPIPYWIKIWKEQLNRKHKFGLKLWYLELTWN